MRSVTSSSTSEKGIVLITTQHTLHTHHNTTQDSMIEIDQAPLKLKKVRKEIKKERKNGKCVKERREDKGGVGKGRGNVGRSKHRVLCSATRLTLLNVSD